MNTLNSLPFTNRQWSTSESIARNTNHYKIKSADTCGRNITASISVQIKSHLMFGEFKSQFMWLKYFIKLQELVDLKEKKILPTYPVRTDWNCITTCLCLHGALLELKWILHKENINRNYILATKIATIDQSYLPRMDKSSACLKYN